VKRLAAKASWKPIAPTQGTLGIDETDETDPSAGIHH
jgi:hypothetical protein